MTNRIIYISTLVVGSLSMLTTVAHAQQVSFMKDVAPVLLRRCAGCHGDKKAEGGYRLHTYDYLLTPGDSGERPVVSSQPKESLLLHRILEKDDSIRMPQKDDSLSVAEVSLIKTWISEGAVFDGIESGKRLVTQLPPREHPASPESYRVPVPAQTIVCHPEKNQVAISGYHEILIWDLDEMKLIKRLQNLPQRIQAVIWTETAEQLFVAGGTPGEYGELSLVDVDSGERTKVFGTFDDIVLCCAVNSDGNRVAVGTAAKETRMYDLKTSELLWQTRSHSNWVTGVAFSHDDRFVVTTSRDQTAKVHLAHDGTLFTIYNGHRLQLGGQSGRFTINDIRSDANTRLLYSAGEGSSIRVWDPVKAKDENGTAADMEGRFFKMGHTRFIAHNLDDQVLILKIHGDKLAVAGANGRINIFRISDGQEIASFDGHGDWVFSLDFSADGSRVISGDFSGEIRVWDIKAQQVLKTLQARPNQ